MGWLFSLSGLHFAGIGSFPGSGRMSAGPVAFVASKPIFCRASQFEIERGLLRDLNEASIDQGAKSLAGCVLVYVAAFCKQPDTRTNVTIIAAIVGP
jgi:hypothetical protein